VALRLAQRGLRLPWPPRGLQRGLLLLLLLLMLLLLLLLLLLMLLLLLLLRGLLLLVGAYLFRHVKRVVALEEPAVDLLPRKAHVLLPCKKT
jgi:hypothetical protein